MQSCCAINMSCLAFSVLCHAPSDALVLLVLVADEPALRVKTFFGRFNVRRSTQWLGLQGMDRQVDG